MAWPTKPNAGDLIEDTLMDDIIDAIALWGGDVDAGNHSITNLASIEQEAWSNATYQNSWISFGAPYPALQYRKDTNGRVWIRGGVKNGTITNGTVIATLPVGYRPPGGMSISLEGVQSNGVLATAIIDASGNIALFGVSSNTLLHIYGSFASDA